MAKATPTTAAIFVQTVAPNNMQTPPMRPRNEMREMQPARFIIVSKFLVVRRMLVKEL